MLTLDVLRAPVMQWLINVNKAFAREHGYDFKLAVAAQRGRFSGLFTGVLLGHHGSLRSVFLFVMGRGLFPESFPLVALAWSSAYDIDGHAGPR